MQETDNTPTTPPQHPHNTQHATLTEPTLVGLRKLSTLLEPNKRTNDMRIHGAALMVYDLVNKWLPLRFVEEYRYFPIVEEGNSELCQQYQSMSDPYQENAACTGCPVFAHTKSVFCVHIFQPSYTKPNLTLHVGDSGVDPIFRPNLTMQQKDVIDALIVQHLTIASDLLRVLRAYYSVGGRLSASAKPNANSTNHFKIIKMLDELERNLEFVEYAYYDAMQDEI